MKKKWSPKREEYFRGGKAQFGVEYHHYPSAYAQDHWLHIFILGQSRTPVGFRYDHQREPRFLLHYLRHGTMWHSVGEQRLAVSARQAILMDLREPVRYGNEGPSTADNWWVCFHGKEMPDLHLRLRADQNPLFTGLDGERFEKLFRELIGLTRRSAPAYEIRADGLLTLLLGELLAVRDEGEGLCVDLVPLATPLHRLSVPVRDTIRYIARFHDHALSLKILSSVVDLSLSHYSHQFQRETGLSPMQYLTQYRMEKAKRILQTGRHPIQRVAQMVGVPNFCNFSRLFHRFTGMSPKDYRAKRQATSDSRTRLRR